nr:CDP-alcohol phosphatidyltransferase family protein [Dehalococcoidia bacterium]
MCVGLLRRQFNNRTGNSRNMAEFDSELRQGGSGLEIGESQMPLILSFVADWPNIVTLVGLCCGVLAIFFALHQNYPAAIISILWAVTFDWYDGVVARALPDRSAQ